LVHIPVAQGGISDARLVESFVTCKVAQLAGIVRREGDRDDVPLVRRSHLGLACPATATHERRRPSGLSVTPVPAQIPVASLMEVV